MAPPCTLPIPGAPPNQHPAVPGVYFRPDTERRVTSSPSSSPSQALDNSLSRGPSLNVMAPAVLATVPTDDVHQTVEQTKARRARLIANERSGVACGRAGRSRSPVTPAKISHGGVDKKSKRSGKATESKLSSELERLLVGDDLPAGQTRAPNRMQHPLRAVLHNLPGFTFGSELDSVKFCEPQRVIVGINTLMAEGGDERGKDLAKEWLEGFLLLTFETIANVLERYRMCKELDDVPLGYITMASDVETKINSLPDDPLSSPDDPSFKSRRAMESQLCQSNNLQKLVEWTISARRRFLQHKPKSMPGFGTFVQAVQHEGSDLEKRLWAAVDAQARKKDV
ncbi:hypothetical protein CTRI78_v002161 [Colletotrichum trifolii]|uniref:Uncharacterized protein n=1 Tax=Colletotrichum trifolii TaxID=5466 RepID=A0A4R8RY19_COLTR|nr:hypothetical protein CTRI78_v002161 [Colletotrichum trifolii]